MEKRNQKPLETNKNQYELLKSSETKMNFGLKKSLETNKKQYGLLKSLESKKWYELFESLETNMKLDELRYDIHLWNKKAYIYI